MQRLAGAAIAALLLTISSTSAKPTDGWYIRGVEETAIESKVMDLQIMVPHTGVHVTLRKPLNQTKTLICGVLRPRSNPAIDVYFSALVEISEVVKFDVDNDEAGKIYQFCRKIDMSMP